MIAAPKAITPATPVACKPVAPAIAAVGLGVPVGEAPVPVALVVALVRDVGLLVPVAVEQAEPWPLWPPWPPPGLATFVKLAHDTRVLLA